MKNLKLDSKFSMAMGVVVAAVFVFVVMVLTVLWMVADVGMLWLGIVGAAGVIVFIVVGVINKSLKDAVADPARRIAAQAAKLTTPRIDGELTGLNDDELGDIGNSINAAAAEIIALRQAVTKLEKEAKENEDDMADALSAVRRLTRGDSIIRLRTGRPYTEAMNSLVGVIGGLHSDMATQATAATDGNFLKAIDESKYEGNIKKLAQQTNAAAAAIAAQIGQMEQALGQLGKGHLTGRIDQTGKGDFAKLNNSFNNAATNLEKSINNINADILAASNRGQLRADYPADFSKIRDSLMDLLRKMDGGSPSPAPTLTRPLVRGANDNSNTRQRSSDANHMSGASKAILPGLNKDYMRNDFGKY